MNSHPFFDKLWEAYPKKVNKHSAQKAFMAFLAMENSIDLERLLLAVRVYSMTNDPDYYHDLGNWLRGDHWKDIYSTGNIGKIVERHQKNQEEADRFIKHWNANKQKWWQEIVIHASRRKIVIKAMEDPFFFDNWEKAFDIAKNVFKRRAPERDWKSNITPNIEWFCRSGTIAKLIEGGFGSYKKRNIKFKDRVLKDGKTHVQVIVNEDSKEPEPLDHEIKKMIEDLKQRISGDPKKTKIPKIFQK